MLQAVKRVYIDLLGGDSFSLQLRENLTSALQTSNRFELVSNRDDADAVFKGADKILAPGWQPRVLVDENLLSFEHFEREFIGQLRELKLV